MISACSHAPESERMLDKRSNYDDVSFAQMNIQNMTSRSKSKAVLVWAYPEELPTGDYFWGSWISMIIQDESWAFDNKKKK